LDKAAAVLKKAAESGSDPTMGWYWLGLAQLDAADLVGYHKSCAAILDRFGKAANVSDSHLGLWACVLAPDAVADYPRLVQWAERQSAAQSNTFPHRATLGAALYRAGRLDKAAQRLQEDNASWEQASIGCPLEGSKPTVFSPAYMWFFLALAHHRLAHAEEARRWLDKAIQWMDQEIRNTSPSWSRTFTLQLLRREAVSLLGVVDKKPPTKRK
jgi:tetratricopeptide (TPR) repeat protein